MKKTIQAWGVVLKTVEHGPIWSFMWPIHDDLPYCDYAFFSAKSQATAYAKNIGSCYEATVVRVTLPSPEAQP